MDNLTHTLIGATVAHSLPKKLRKPEIYWASLIGNNLPDADVLQKLIPGTDELDSLVHHRGYTHSFFIAFALAYVGSMLVALITKPKGKRRVTREIYFFTLLGCFFHIGADFMNSYGVHPFTPFIDQWFYGDSVFIIEPWIWMMLLPMAIALALKTSAKRMWTGFLALGLALIWFVDYVVLPVKMGVTLMAGLSYWVHRTRTSARLAAVALISVIAMFFSVSALVKQEVRATSHAPYADIEATPAPGNPFCWGSWSQRAEGGDYVMRLALVTPFPRVLGPEQCGAWRVVTPTSGGARIIDQPDTSNVKILWRVESRLKQKDYQFLYDHSCRFQKLMSFVRFPYLSTLDGKSFIAGDMRYDMRDRKNFTEMQIDDVDATKTTICSGLNAPWMSPFLRRSE